MFFDIESIKQKVWSKGLPVTNGKSWKVMEFPGVIGASGGKVSRWMRVEESAGVIHGHPITKIEFQRLLR